MATDMDVRVTVDQPHGNVLSDVGPMDAALTEAVLNWSPRGTGGGIVAAPIGGKVTGSVGGQVCWCTGSTWEEAATSAASCGADYLMIVTDSLASSGLIDSLAMRRASYNGFNVAIAKVSQLDALPDTLETPVAIRAMIDSVYASQSAAHMSDGRLGYVVLVGDAFDTDRNVLVPSYYGYQSGDSLLAASDAYYSFLDDPATDRLPDILLGRLPVDDDPADWELTNVVTKIIAYEPLPASTWADSVLMVSGVNDGGFTFQTEGLTGFQEFFDSVLAHHPPPGRSVTQLHRLTLPPNEGNHGTFGETVASAIEGGKWLTAFFDHGFLYYWEGTFYPRNYEFLENDGEPTIVLSLGSQTCQFDNTQETGQAWYEACCTWPPPQEPPFSIGCESPGYEYIDPCDAMAERLLVQPGGAIAVIGYSRSQGTTFAQSDLVNLFRSLSQQNPGTLGEFLVGARLFSLSNSVTARNLMLLGDPALNMRTRAPAPADTFDVAVGTSDIRSPWATYVRSTRSPVEVAVRNAWKTDVYELEVELWRGEPGVEGSTLLATEGIDTLRAHGPEIVSFSVSGLEGNVRLYVVLDPDDLIPERAEDNNIAFRDFLALSYEGAYPMRLPFTVADRSVTIADLTSAIGKEFLVSGANAADRLLQCYAVGDTNAVWTYSTGSFDEFIKNQPAAGHLYKSASSYVMVEQGSSVRILSGQSGSVVKTRSVGDARIFVNGWEAKWLLSDLGPDDSAMELVMLRYVDGGVIDSLQVRAFAPDAASLFTRAVDVGNSTQPATMAVADLDRNGSKEIVILQVSANVSESPAAGKELTVLSYGAGGLTYRWQADLANGGSIANPAVVLIDRNGDGNLSILCNGAYPGPILRLYDAGSTPVWTMSTLTAGYPIYFAAGDINGDGTAEVAVLDHERVRLLSSANGFVIGTPRTMPGDPVAPPLLVDLDADGTLEMVVVFEQKDPNADFYPPDYWTQVSVLDENLNLFQPEWTFRTRSSSGSSCLPAIDDIDDDGKYEMVYVSPDQYLHVFELGSAAGEAAWSQRFANALNTGLNEQPIIGDGYTNPVSLYQKTKMLDHVTLDSTTAPSLYVGHGTEIRVDASVFDSFQLRAFGSIRMKGSATEPVVIHTDPPASGDATWGGLYVDNRSASPSDPDTLSYVQISDASVGIEAHSALQVTSSTISNVFEAGIVSFDTLQVSQCDVVASSDFGIHLLDGLGRISDSRVEGALIALVAAQGAPLTIRSSTISNVADAGVIASDTLWFDRSSVTSSSGLGIKLASGAVGRIRRSVISNTDSTAVFCDSCAPQSTLDSTTVRAAGADGVYIIGNAMWQGTNGIEIDSCTVEDNAGVGVRFESAHGTLIRSRVKGNAVGIVAGDASGPSEIEHSVVEASDIGIDARNGATILLSNSAVRNCLQFGALILAESSLDATETLFEGNGIAAYLAMDTLSWVAGAIRDCSFTDNGHGVWVVDSGDSLVIVEDCTFENNSTTGMYLEGAKGEVHGTTFRGAAFGINAHIGSMLTLSNSIIEGASLYGVLMFRNSRLDVSGTSFNDNDIGLCLTKQTDAWIKATIFNCSFTNNGDGIWIDEVGDSAVVVNECIIDSSATNGVYVEGGGAVTVRQSTITNATNGIYAYESSTRIRPRNTIQHNTAGIVCEQYSTAAVESCLVTDNVYGVMVRNGADPDLGHTSGGNSTGFNILTPTISYYVYNRTSNSIGAEQNYWPANPPTLCLPLSSKIYGPVDADPALCTPPGLGLQSVELALDADEVESAFPQYFELAQNFPNPFNPATTVSFSVPRPGAHIRISVYDVRGRLVAVLLDEHRGPGRHRVTWDGHNRTGGLVASGLYFLRLKTDTFVDTKKLLLLR